MSAASHRIRPGLRTAAVCTGLFAGTLWLFARCLDAGFSIYDDPSYITNNLHVQAGLTGESIRWAFVGRADYWHPLTWLSHMLDWQVYRDSAAGHHLTSVLWHSLNAVLAFCVLRRLTGRYRMSIFAAALFAWHPLRVESVAWITERKDVMSGCFFLLTLWAYSAYARCREDQRRSWPAYGLTLALFLAGLMCKPMLVSLPAVLLILDFWPLRRAALSTGQGRRWLQLAREKLPFFALSLATCFVTVWMQEDKGAFVLNLSLGARLANALVSLTRYLGKFFWPFNLTVCYPHPGHWPTLTVAGATLLIGALTALAWRERTTRPWILAGWCWFVVMLLPAIGIVQVGFQAMADRYTYLPVLGLELALLWTIPALEWNWLRVTGCTLAGIAVLTGCSLRTWNQEGTWRDSVTLFRHAIDVTHRNAFAHAFLGYTYDSLGRPDDAAREANAALAIEPANETALFTLASAQELKGELVDADATYRRLLAIQPADTNVEFHLGLLLLRRGKTEEGIRRLKAATQRDFELRQANIQIATTAALHGQDQVAAIHFKVAAAADPRDADAEFGLAMAESHLGQADAAVAHFKAALERRPDFPEAHQELGFALLSRDQPANAATHFRAALAHNPALGLAHFGLGRSKEKLGQAAEAAADFERAAELAPNHPLVQRAWAQTLAKRGQFAEAAAHYEKAVKLQPADAGAHAELGFALWLSGQHEQAIAAWKDALRLDPQFPGLRARLERLGVQ